MTLIQIQGEYIDTVNAGYERWKHRTDMGHYSRIRRGAKKQAVRKLTALGFTVVQAGAMVTDAHEMALLERYAE